MIVLLGGLVWMERKGKVVAGGRADKKWAAAGAGEHHQRRASPP
jgi:hypothetical protein